jgi:hypothetical protein
VAVMNREGVERARGAPSSPARRTTNRNGRVFHFLRLGDTHKRGRMRTTPSVADAELSTTRGHSFL